MGFEGSVCRCLLGTPVCSHCLHLAFDNRKFCIFFSLLLRLLNPDATLCLHTLTHVGTHPHTDHRHLYSYMHTTYPPTLDT